VSKLNKYARLISYLLVIASLIYITKIIIDSNLDFTQFQNPIISAIYIILFGIFASFFVLINAYSWKLILEFVNGDSLAIKDIFQVYLKSNIAKYLPGNIMHYAGRNYLGNRLGWKNHEIALSSILEYIFNTCTIVTIIIIFIILGLVNIPPQVSLNINFIKFGWYFIAGTTCTLIFIYFYRYFICKENLQETTKKIWHKTKQFFTIRFLKLLVILFLISLFSFILNCFFYYYLCYFVLDFQIKTVDFFNANAALSIANFTTILTPGVPAGMGVKESASFLLISAYGYPSGLLMLSMSR